MKITTVIKKEWICKNRDRDIWEKRMSERVITFSFLNGVSTALFEDFVIAFPKEVIKQEKSESMCLISTDPDGLQAYN